MTLSKKGARVVEAAPYVPGMVPNDHRLRTKNLPATGGIVVLLDGGIGMLGIILLHQLVGVLQLSLIHI